MANIQLEESFIPTGWEIIPYKPRHQEASDEIGDSSSPIAAIPISFYAPEQGDGSSMRKRRRCTKSEVVEDTKKDFSLWELYKSDNIHEIIKDRQKGITTTIDPELLLQNLKGWTLQTTKRPEINGKRRHDRFYWHPASRRKLRSLLEVKKFIDENSNPLKTSNNGGSSQDAVGLRFDENNDVTIPRPSVIGQSIYSQQFERLKIAMNHVEGQGC